MNTTQPQPDPFGIDTDSRFASLTASPGARQLRSIIRARIIGAGAVSYVRLPATPGR